MHRCALLLPLLLTACATTPPSAETPDAPAPAAPKAAPGPSPQAAMATLAPLGQQLVADQWTGALVIALVTPDSVEVRGFGEAADTPEAQVFEIGSITKVFTGMALASLTEQGVVSPSTPLADCLPPGTKLPAGEPITLGQLTTHTSGLPRLPVNLALDAATQDPYATFTEAMLLEGLGETPLGAKRYSYSNLGVGLLGVALTRCAGAASWEALIAERVTGPLGLTKTGVNTPLTTSGHDMNMELSAPWRFDALAGAGALHSDAADMARLLQQAMRGDAAPAMLRRSVAPLTTTPPVVGMGWHHGMATSGPLTEVVWHNGMTGGWSAWIGYLPGQQRGVVVLSSAANMATDELALAAMRVWTGQPTGIKPPPLAKLDAAACARLAGAYRLSREMVLTVEARGDQLWAGATGQPTVRIWPESATKVHYRVVAATLDFTLPESGPATQVTLHQGLIPITAPREP